MAALAPNGKRLAVGRTAGVNRMALSSVSLATGRERRLVDDLPLFANGFAWAPDSTRLAVVDADMSVAGGDLSLSVVNATTGRVEPVLAPGTGGALNGWSPEGSRLLLTRLASQSPAAPMREVLLVDLPDGSIRALGDGWNGSFSPDGHSIALFEGYGVHLVDVDTGARRTIAARHGQLQSDIAWSADGRQIAYADGDTPGIGRLAVTAVDGSGTRLVGATFSTPIWSGGDLVWTPGSRVLGGIAVYEVAARHTRLLNPLPPKLASMSYIGVVGVFPGGGRVVYAVYSRSRSQGFRSVGLDGRGDRPLLPCRGLGHGSRVLGTAAADVINTRNSSRDGVSCGGSVDTVVADPADRIDRDCERVRRTR
jgi:dipeptidyl aminopeptidase/acylaminoacyl peptidase